MTNDEFCANVKSLIGESYTQTDCIAVVRKAAKIRCQGTNWLWRSYKNSGKYQYLTQRMERPPTISELTNGLLVFRIRWDEVPKGYTDKPNCHHVGVIVDHDKVVQSQENRGVTIKPYYLDEWNGCGWLKFVDFPVNDIYDPIDLEPEPDPIITDHGEDNLYSTGFTSADHAMLLALYNKFIID